ncbi:transposase, partial [Corallococcus terminator]
MERWKPTVEQSAREQRLLKLAGKSRKLFVFLREHRHELFDEAFQDELEAMYRQTGQGQAPQPPAMMCMALLVQAYTQASDAEAVCLSGTDSRWRMVLDRLGADEDEPAFSQGGLQQFRERLIATQMDRRLLERTVEVAKRTKGFDSKKTPKTLRVGVDSRPLEGAGRVEDTLNLLGHAGRKVAEGMALALGTDVEEVIQQADAPLLRASSIKAGLDIDWSAPDAKLDALNRLCRQLDRLMAWVAKQSKSRVAAALTRSIEALAQVREQDLEPRSEGGVQIRQGVAADRRISIEDADMR